MLHLSLLSTAALQASDNCPADMSTPPVPERIASVLNEHWEELDPDATLMLDSLRSKPGFMHFSHAREVFKDHLIGTWTVLEAWGQPRTVSRAGLFHTGYSGDLFQFYFWDAADADQRKELRSIVGKDAEHLIFMFGCLHRGTIFDLGGVMKGDDDETGDSVGLEEIVEVHHRLLGNVTLESRVAAQIIMVTLADYMDQMVENNGWRDHHQVESPLSLYPGDMRPAVCLYWVSKMCRRVSSLLEVVPPMFGRCTEAISRTDEERARDLYWSVVLADSRRSSISRSSSSSSSRSRSRSRSSSSGSHTDGDAAAEEQAQTLADAIALNPFVGEPEVLLAQLHFRKGNYERAVAHTRAGLLKFYVLGTAWDKRLKFSAWVAFARLLLLRAQRKAAGLPSLPSVYAEGAPGSTTSSGMPLISIPELVAAM